jgi:hypothetical protein
MALLIDRIFTYGHRFWGTAADDRMIGNGSPGSVIFGGNGNDDINPGINPSLAPRDQIKIYGGVSLPGFDPRNPLPGSIGGLHNDGRDTLHGGANIEAKGGSGADTYVAHGPIREAWNRPFDMPTFNPHEGDTIIFAHDRGYDVKNIRVYDTWSEGGDKFLHLWKVDLVGHSQSFNDEQHLRVGFADDQRGAHTETIIEWSGRSYADDVARWIADEGFLL